MSTGTFVTANEEIERLTKQKDQAYSERNKVVAALAHLIYDIPEELNEWNIINVGVAQHQGEDWEDDWRTVLVIDVTGRGQITWHFHDSEKYLLEGLPRLENYQWDGHTTEEKYKRLLEFVGIKASN